MIYILMLFYTFDGKSIREELPMPDYRTCTQQKQMWLAESHRYWIKDAEAYCVGRKP